jgi:hypothetical protein
MRTWMTESIPAELIATPMVLGFHDVWFPWVKFSISYLLLSDWFAEVPTSLNGLEDRLRVCKAANYLVLNDKINEGFTKPWCLHSFL